MSWKVKSRAAYQGAEVDTEGFLIGRGARNNSAVEDTLDNKMHVPAGLSQPDQGLGMAGNPYSIADSLEEVLTNVLEELRGKLEKWASQGALTSGCPCQWRHLECGWRVWRKTEVTGGQGGHVHDYILFLAFVNTFLLGVLFRGLTA